MASYTIQTGCRDAACATAQCDAGLNTIALEACVPAAAPTATAAAAAVLASGTPLAAAHCRLRGGGSPRCGASARGVLLPRDNPWLRHMASDGGATDCKF